MGVCNCSMFDCTLLYVHSSIAIILMGKRELVALLNLSSWLSGSSSWCHRVVCGLWYFLIILNYYFWHCETSLSPPVTYLLKVPRQYFFVVLLYFFCLCALSFICALWSPAGRGLTSWLSFVVSNCEFVTIPLASLVRSGTWLYRFLIFAPLLTLILIHESRSYWSVATHMNLLSLLC